MASRILTSWRLPGTTLAPSRNFLPRTQLELSVNSMSPTSANPSLIVTIKSPASSGRLPVLSLTIFLSNSRLDQVLQSPFGKSPSRTTISTLIEEDRVVGTIWSPIVSTIRSWSGLLSASPIFVPVNIDSPGLLVKISCKFDCSKPWIRKEGDLVKVHERIPRSTSSFTWETSINKKTRNLSLRRD